MKRLVIFFGAVLGAQELLEVPPLAHVRDSGGRLSPIYGIAGNFIHGPAGAEVLAYSNDGEIEWRLEPGRLVARRDGREAFYPTSATAAEFRANEAFLPDTGESIRLEGETLLLVAPGTPPATAPGKPATAAHVAATAAIHPVKVAAHPSTAATHPSTAAIGPATAADRAATAATHPVTVAAEPSTAATNPAIAATDRATAAHDAALAATRPPIAATHLGTVTAHPSTAATHPSTAAIGPATAADRAATAATHLGTVTAHPSTAATNPAMAATGPATAAHQAATAATHPATVAGRGIDWRDGQLTVTQPGGGETVIDCPDEPSEITAAAANWARLTIGRQAYLLRLDAGRVELFVLPARRRP